MRAYIEITSVPLKRENTAHLSPAARLAARLTDAGETVEFRLQKLKGKICCFLGIDSLQRGRQAMTVLAEPGCGYRLAENVPAVSSGAVMTRKIYENYNVIPGQNRRRTVVINEILPEAERLKSLYYSLSRMADGCGYSVFIRAAGKLDISVTTFLKNMADQSPGEESLYSRLFYARALYQCCVCIFGKEADDVSFLQSELTYAFPGMEIRQTAGTRLEAKDVWRLADSLAFPVPVRGSTAVLSTFLYSELEALTALDGMPLVKGIRINRDSLFPEQETERGTEKNGKGQDGRTLLIGVNEAGEEQRLPLGELKKHMFISGAPGTGKGNLIFSIANQLHQYNVPVLLIESAKQEQHYLRRTMPGLRVWRPKGGEYVLNPFSLPPDVTLEDYRASLKQIMQTCFRGDGPLEELYGTTLSRCLARHGYTESSMQGSPGTVPFGLSEFITEYNRLLTTNGYSDKTQHDMRTAGVTRLRALFDQNPDVFDSVQSVPVSELVKGENLLQLNCLTTLEAKQMFATILLVSLGAWLRFNGKHSRGLQLVVILDESHNLLRGVEKSSGETYSFAEDFQNLLLEMRSIGVGFIVADQSAYNLPQMISEVCATKIFLGPSRFSGIESYAKVFRADDAALEHLYLLGAGEGAWNTYGMSGGAYFSSPNVIDRYHMEEPYPAANTFIEKNQALMCQTFQECKTCASHGKCTVAGKQAARRQAAALTAEHKGSLVSALREARHAYAAKKPGDEESQNRNKAANAKMRAALQKISDEICSSGVNTDCCMVQFVRQFNREAELPLAQLHIDALYTNIENRKKKGGVK